MRNEFTAIIEKDGDWHVAHCPEIPGANGQGRTKQEAKKSLAEAIELILQDRREECLRGVPEDAVIEVVSVGSDSKKASTDTTMPADARRDPIVEEVRQVREQYAAQFNHDLKAICRDLRERENKSGRKVVSLPPKRVPKESAEGKPAR